MVGTGGPSLPLTALMLFPAIHAFCPCALDVCIRPRRTAVSSYMRKGNEAGTCIRHGSSLHALECAEHRRKGVPGRMKMSMMQQEGDYREEMISIGAQIARVEEEIDQVSRQVREAEKRALDPNIDKDERQYWRKEKEQLRKEKEQLRRKEEQLRRKEEQLRDLFLIEAKRTQDSKKPEDFLPTPQGNASSAQV